MKILYAADDRGAAGLAARALQGSAPAVALTWARTFASALEWVQANRDATAVIVEDEVQGEGYASFLGQVRGLGLATPIVVVMAIARREEALAALNAGADGCVVAGASLLSELPRVLARAVERRPRSVAASGVARSAVAWPQAERPLEAAEQASRRVEPEPATAATQLAELQARHTAALAREARICTALQQRLLELEAAVRTADERQAAESVAFADQLAKRHAEFTANLSQAAQSRDSLAAQLAAATAALDEAQHARRADAEAAAERLREREAQFAAQLQDVAAARTAVEGTLAQAEGAYQDAIQRAQADLAAANERQAALEDLLAQEADRCKALDRKVAAAEAAVQDLDQRRTRELEHAAGRLADLQAQHDAAVVEHAAARTALEQQLAEAGSALDLSARERESTAAAAAEHLRRREAELAAQLEESAAAKAALERALAQAEASHQETRQKAEADLAAARGTFEQQLAAAASALERIAREREAEQAASAGQLRDQEAEFGARRAEAAAAITVLEAALARSETALRDAAQRAEADVSAANERRATLEGLLASESETRTAAERKLAAVEASLRDANQRYTTDLATAAENLSALQGRFEAQVTAHAAALSALEQELGGAHAARAQADERTAAALAAAEAREADLAGQLAAESGTRGQLGTDLAALREHSAQRRRRSLRVTSAARRRSRERTQRLEAELAGERAAAERRLRARDDEIREIRQEHDRTRQLLGTAQEQLRRLHASVDDERQAYARARETSEAELQRVSVEYSQLRRSFDQLQAAFQALERVAGDHAAERARLERVVAERDSQLSTQAERHRAAEQIAQDALAQLRERLRHVVESSRTDTARLQQEIDRLGRDLGAARTHAEALRAVAGRVPDLEGQLHLGERERRRWFESAPYGLCRCTAEGAIADANHALVALLGRRRADQLRNMDFAAAVADSAGDIGWLIERARATGKAQAADTGWKAQRGRELVVHLQVLPTPTGAFDVVVEDVTRLRSLEEQLRRAGRLEAVGRLASEVAGTCGTLLRDAARDAREWLAAASGDESLRRRGEMLLADLARAEGHLGQLGAFGDAQARALEPVNVQRVLGDLAPVLKRIAGDDLELSVSKTSGAFEVDVEAERVERVLVGVAGCARERMPRGGQLKIELATATLGRKFLSRHPGVRPGTHVLVTVSGIPRAGEPRDAATGNVSAGRPGLELAGLAELVTACGGHLWMDTQPAGILLIKVHLPRFRTIQEGASEAQGAGRLARWFRTVPGAAARS